MSENFGAPPRNRTAHAEVVTRPLATCCCGAWHPRGDSNTQSRVWNPLASPSATGASGAPGRIRTDTRHGLSVLPLPSWATSLWCSGRDSNSQQCGPRPHASTSCAIRTLVGSSRIRTSEIPNGYRVYGAALSASQPTAQSELSKIWRKAGDSNAYVPRHPGLANQWDTSDPSLPATNFKWVLEGNYRLDERHQDCPTVSRYDRRPRLKKRRIEQ